MRICIHVNRENIGNWHHDGRRLIILECQDCGAIQLGEGPWYWVTDRKPHWKWIR